MWEVAQHPSSVGLPVRSMAVDSRGFCWVGDEAGIIRVLMLDPQNSQLNLKVQLAPPQAQGLLNLAMRFGPTAAANAFKESFSTSSTSSLVRPGSRNSSTDMVRAAPITAMCSKGLAVFSTGGKLPYNITVWHSQRFSELEVSTCESFGATCSLAILPWDAPSAATGANSGSSGVSSDVPVTQGDNSTEVAGIPATGIAVGYSTVQPSATDSAQVMKQSLAKQAAGAAGSASSSAADTNDYSSWRLLSGHEHGQVLLWQSHGIIRSRGTKKLLQLLSVIGEPRAQCAVHSMAVFDDLSMLLLVHDNGELTAMPMPNYNNLPASSNSGGANISAAALPAGGPGAMFGAASLHHWTPRLAHIKAHKSPVVAAACRGELLVTGTSGTVKSWTAEGLKLEAQGKGLMFSRKNKAFSAASTAAALEAATSAADNCTSLGSAGLDSPSRVAAGQAGAAGVAGVDQDEDSRPPPRRQQQQLHGSMTGHHFSHQRSGPATTSATRAGVVPVAAGPVPALRKAANPMSRESVKLRGFQTPPAELSTFQFLSPHLASSLPGYPLPGTGPKWQVLPGCTGDQPSGWREEPSQSTPRGSALDAGGFSGNSEASLSSLTSHDIKPHQSICNSELTLKEVIASGVEGKVYRGTWTNIDIAAKEYLGVNYDETDSAVANSESSSEAAMQRARDALRKEVALLMCFNHPNLVRFCGVCLDPPLVVMEFYKHGNVFQMIEKARRQWANNQARPGAPTPKQATKYMNYFTWDRRLEMLHDVSAGMMYLHKRHYVHGNLRSSKLFVGLDGRVKIGDVGFAKRLDSQQRSMQNKRITHPRWVAPELMTDHRLSVESDIYSFGIIMYEMLTWQLPFYNLTTEEVVYHGMAGTRPDIPVTEQLPPGTSSSTCLSSYIKLMQDCWDHDLTKRPHFDRIAARLKAMIHWRMVVQRNQVLARVAGKLKAAGQAQRAMPVPSPASTAFRDAPVAVDAAGPVASGMPAAAQGVLQMAAPAVEAAFAADSAFAKSPPVPDMAACTVDEEGHEPLPKPEQPIVQVPDLVAEADIESAAIEPPVIPVACARRWQQRQVPWLQQQQWQQAALPTPTGAADASTPGSDLGPLPQPCGGSTVTPQQRPTSYAAEKQLHLGLPGLTAVLARRISNGRQVLLLQLQLRQRLQPIRQAQLLQNVHGAAKQRHPHVLRLQDACFSRRCLKCVTEPCSISLVQYIQQRGGRLSEGLSRWLFQQLVLGLDYCHRQGVAGIPVNYSLLQMVPDLPQPVVKLIPIPFESSHPTAASAAGLQERIADDLQQCGLLLGTMLGGTVASAAGSQLQDAQYRVPMGVSRACQWFLADLMQQHRKALPTAASILWHPWVKQNLPQAALGLHESCLAQAQQWRQGQAAPAASLNSSITLVLQQLQQDLQFLQQQLQHCVRAAQQVPQAGLLPLTLQHSLYGAGAACTAMLQALSTLQQGAVRGAVRRSTHTQVATHLQMVTLQQALSAVNNSVDDFLLQLQLHQLPTQQWRQQQQKRGQQQKAAGMQLLTLLLSSWRVLTAAKRAEANARHCRATANHVVVAFLCPAHPRLPQPPELVQQQQRTPIDLVQPLVLVGLTQIMIQYAWPWHCNTGTVAVGLLSLLLQLPGAVGIAVAHDRTEGSSAVHEQLQQLPAELLVLQQERVTADALSTALYAAQQGHQQLWIAGLHLQSACAGAQADSWQGSEHQQQGQQQAAGKHPLMLRAQQQQQPCSLQQYQPLLKLLRHLPLSQVVNEQQFLGASQPGTAELPTASSTSHTSADGSAAGAFSTVMGLCCSPPLLLMQQPPGGRLECWLQTQQQLLQYAAGSSSSTVSIHWARLAPWQLLLQLLTEVAEALCIMHELPDLAAHGHVHAGAVFLLQRLPDIGTGASWHQQGLPRGQRLSQLSLIGPWQQVASDARTFRPCITAGEVLLTAAPVSPATDVYGFGILMLQLAACWVPQQHEPGSDQQLAEMRWCHKMLGRTGSTFPLADTAAAVAAEVAESSWDLESSDVMQWLPQLPPAGNLPAGYVALMHECCCVDATARPATQHLLQRLSVLTA